MFFIIETRLPSLNEVIKDNRSGWQVAAERKRELEEVIGYYIIAARRRGTLRPIDEPVVIEIEWHESTKKCDVDNIQSAQKFILDALQKQGILINDNRKYVKQIYHQVVDDEKDFVIVVLRNASESNETVLIPLLKRI